WYSFDSRLGSWTSGQLRRRMRVRLYMVCSLFAADGQTVDAKRGGRHRSAEFQIVGDLGNVEEHFFQISCHSDLFDGICQLAVGDPERGSATEIVAGDQVRT